MNIRNLKTFLSASSHLNFTRTAEELNFAQPTVTAQIHSLEKELNQKLFYRINNKIILTPAGEILKEKAEKLLEVIEEINEDFEALYDPYGEVRVAASEFYCTHYFPQIIANYNELHSANFLALHSCHSNDVIDGVYSNHYDIGIISGVLSSEAVHNIILEEEELLLVCSPALLTNSTPISELTYIHYKVEGHYKREMDRFLHDIDLQPATKIEIGSEEGVKRAIINKMGLGLVSQNLVKHELRKGLLVKVPLEAPPITIETSLICLKDKAEEPNIKSLKNLIINHWPESFEDYN
ncbi:LysR family transcriptional regulator [Alteribacillus sp. HJP-4]|uniref:LysR family transcriptional regulator n=1 Tax=Alteribacillus sp. HJP-4 TaxID=2775394 RepID=UPI0035CCF3EE